MMKEEKENEKECGGLLILNFRTSASTGLESFCCKFSKMRGAGSHLSSGRESGGGGGCYAACLHAFLRFI